MKRIFIVVLLVSGSVFVMKASAQTNTESTTTTTHRYYFFPDANVYYDPDAQFYWYHDEAVDKWIRQQSLPGTIVVKKTPRYIVRYKGDDPWKNNVEDLKKFKVKKNGEIKIKE